eukprot:CAMPEP_0179425808 /NCGR_PEP_ID=MMETSP0799-20121207/12381_1 /TAXON_ID=46947 /ORGANISM="Geminigera cryophila, Strain CCMP2564" /LENGTH=407 /DNA_ID=CAMNT_0021200475 /DNA_START=57 /DNA_END=1280 /DNA_ORIENTATION=-
MAAWKCKDCQCMHPADFGGCGKCLKTRLECEDMSWICRDCKTMQPADFKGCGKCLKTRAECELMGGGPLPPAMSLLGGMSDMSQSFSALPPNYPAVPPMSMSGLGGWKEGDPVSVPGYPDGTFTFGGVSADQVYYVNNNTGESTWALSLFGSSFMASAPSMPPGFPSGGSSFGAMSSPFNFPAPMPMKSQPMMGMRWPNQHSNSKQMQSRDKNSHNMQSRDKNTYKAREGDWLCPKCSRISYATRATCFRCNTARPSERHIAEGDGPVSPPISPPGSPKQGSSHAGANGQSRRNCKFWTTYGNCSRGSTCQFVHDPSQQGAAARHSTEGANKRFRGDGGDANHDETPGSEWICSKCMRVCMGSRSSCYNCTAARPQDKCMLVENFKDAAVKREKELAAAGLGPPVKD